MSGKSRMIGDFTEIEIANIPDCLGWSTINRENRKPFYFPDASQISAMVGDRSRYMKISIFTVKDIGDSFSSLPILVSRFPCPSQIKTVSVIVDPDDSDPRFCQYISKIWDSRETVKSPISSGFFPIYENQPLRIVLLVIQTTVCI